MIRAVVGRLRHLSTATLSVSAYQISGTAGVVRISLSAVRGPDPALAVDLVGVQRRRRARFDGLGLAAPARVSAFDPTGARTEPVRLGLSIVAEAVEDGLTLAALVALGCDVVQGFHIAHPMTAEAIDAWRPRGRAGPQPPSDEHRWPARAVPRAAHRPAVRRAGG